jgi:hypothetical protein
MERCNVFCFVDDMIMLGEYQIGNNIKPLVPTTVSSVVQYGTSRLELVMKQRVNPSSTASFILLKAFRITLLESSIMFGSKVNVAFCFLIKVKWNKVTRITVSVILF